MMRKIFKLMNLWVFLCLGTCVMQSCDDDDDVKVAPSAEVLKAFEAKYPGVSPRWDYELGWYEAEFLFNGMHPDWHISMNQVEAEAFFSQSGKWERTDFEVTRYYFNPSETQVIPEAVRTAIAAEAGGRKVDDVKIRDWADKEDTYVVEIDNEPNDVVLVLRFDGTKL